MTSSNHTLSTHRRRTQVFLLTLAAALAIALAAVVPATAEARGTRCKGAKKAPGKLTAGQMRRATMCLINRRRHRAGLRTLRLDRSLRRAATRHSANMVRRDFFSHYSPGGGSTQTRIGGTGYLSGARYFLFGEVIGGGTSRGGSPKRVMKAWMHSGPHRAAILNGSFRDLGVGVAHGYPGSGRRGATFTVDFGRRRG
ncbi:MAG: CAP domain-containing protein [Solirubrobacterales bacterium]